MSANQRSKLGGWVPKPVRKGAPLECRVCLEPSGDVRPCCREPLCVHCWSVEGFCPRCKSEIKMVNQINVKVKEGEYLRAKDAKRPEVVMPKKAVEKTDGEEGKESVAEGGIELAQEAKDDAIECPICLAPGFERKCCGAFYCNDDYFRTGRCPNCDTPCVKRGFDFKVEDPGDKAIGCGWAITHSLTAACLLIFILVIIDEASRRWTVSGYECYKWFDKCDMDKCIDLNNTLIPPHGLTSNVDWLLPECQISTAVNKARGAACVFDPELYRRSGHGLGYDLCWGDMAKEDPALGGMRGNIGNEFNGKGAKFTGGAYVMEDDFEAYTGELSAVPLPTSPQASALWANGTNSEVSSKCGGYSGSNSLRFSGSTDRWAVTKPLDVRYGGYVNFRLKFAPEGNAATDECNSAFIGNVDLYYAAEEEPGVLNDNFTRWQHFIVTEFPLNGKWNLISLKLPKLAWSSGTRFLFDQPVFVDRMDHFAIDDFHVFHKFAPNWHKLKSFKKVKKTTVDMIEDAKCCLGSAQCSRRLSPDQKLKRCDWVPGFDAGYDENHEPMNSTPPLFIMLCIVMVVSKWLWSFGNLLVAQWAGKELDINPVQPPAKCCSSLRGCCSLKLRASAKIYTLDEGPPASIANERRFYVEDDPTWRFGIFFGIGTVPWIAISWYFCYVLLEKGVIIDVYRQLLLEGNETTPFTISLPLWWFLVAAAFLDISALYYVAKTHIYATWFNAVPFIDVDARQSRGVMTITGPTDYEEIKLTDFKTHHRISPKELQYLGLAAVVGCWPFASVTMLLHLARIPWHVGRVMLPLFGALTMLKAYLGGDWLIKALFWFDWLFSRHIDDREEFGLRTKERRTKPMMAVACVVSFSVGLTLLILVDFPAVWKPILFTILITFSGTYWGFLCGVAHALPIEPRLILTSLKKPGIILRYTKHSRYSLPGVGPRWCRHPDRHVCVDVHTRDRLLVVSTDDDQGLYEMLKGITQGELSDF